MNAKYTDKKIKKEIRALALKAHEVELSQALQLVADKFDQWKSGAVPSFEMADIIHKFHDGTAREIFNRYSGPLEKMVVAMAIVNGILKEESVPPEVKETLEYEISFYKDRR